RARRIFPARPFGDALERADEIRINPVGRLPDLSKADDGLRGSAAHAGPGGGKPVNGPNQESLELFFQEASENLQYLREYSGLLQEPQTRPEDLEKLYIAAHSLAGTSASYGYPQFSEVAAKAAHVFHYAMNATLTPDMHGPLTEFIPKPISVRGGDLLQVSSVGSETA